MVRLLPSVSRHAVSMSLNWEIKKFSPQMWEPFRDWLSATHPVQATPGAVTSPTPRGPRASMARDRASRTVTYRRLLALCTSATTWP